MAQKRSLITAGKEIAPETGMHPAVFLDRDGVINQNRADYVRSWEEVVFLPGAFDALRALARSKYKVVVLTNQSAVGRGLLTTAALSDIHTRMSDVIREQDGRLDGIYFCPHRPDENCRCRKPKPGLILEAAADLQIDLGHSYLIGDAVSDVEAAVNAGVNPILVLTGRGAVQLEKMPAEIRHRCRVCPSIVEAAAWVLDHQNCQELP